MRCSHWLAGFAAQRYESRKPWLARLGAGMPACGKEEAVLYQYIMGTLPLTDLGDYSPGLFLAFARHALRVREEFGWCAALPEHIFLKDVLYPRINTEALCDCRGFFYERLRERVKGLALPDAILEVNRWCAENVSYRSTDLRTASALDVYGCKYGRCGEESLFAVNALRSVGIAARQVYAPWWSHCDDNHAWVEAWDGARWRYLGACEPEPRLDMGWFTGAAGRTMLCHTKSFVGDGPGWERLFPEVDPLNLDLREGVAYESVTGRYAPARPFTVTVTGPDGGAVAGAQVEFCVLNEGALRSIARRATDEAGGAALNLGLGSLWVTAHQGGFLAEGLVNTVDTSDLALTLPGSRIDPGRFRFYAPADSGRQNPALTPAEKSRRREVLERARERREGREAFRQDLDGRWASLLTEKDLAGRVPAEAAEESAPLLGREAALASPRIGLEPLAPWRKLLAGAGPDVPPEKLWAWLGEHIAPAGSFAELPQTPAGAWRLGAANGQGRAALFCGLCRARGIPARLGPGSQPEYWRDGGFHRADGQPTGQLTVSREESPSGRLGLMVWDGGWRSMPPDAPRLPQGMYRLFTSTRLPNGDQLGDFRDFILEERREVAAAFPKGDGQGLFQRLALPELGFVPEGLSLLCWVEPGAEPTEHLLNELEELGPMPCPVHFIAEEPGKLRYVPEGAAVHPWDGDAAEAAARRMYLEPGVLPLVILAEGREGRFGLAGYRVGTAELIRGIVQSGAPRRGSPA